VIAGSDHQLSDFQDHLDEVLEFCGARGAPGGSDRQKGTSCD